MKYRNNRRRKPKMPSPFEIGSSDLIPLTDELINSLVRRGFPRSDLNDLRSQGMHYCPARDSFMSNWVPVGF